MSHYPKLLLFALSLVLLFPLPARSQCTPEVCDGLDNDCDGNLDEGCRRTCQSLIEYGDDYRMGNEGYGPRVIWQGSEFAATGHNSFSGGFGSETLFQRLSATGAPLGPLVSFVNKGNAFFAASTAGEYAVVWRPFESTALSFARVDPAGFVIGDETPLGDGQAVGLVWSGSEFGVLFRDPSSDYHLMRIGPLGAIIGSNLIQIGGNVTGLVWSGSEYGVLSRDQDASSDYQLYFSRLDALGQAIGPVRQISASDSGASGGSLVWASGEWGVVWNESVPGGHDLFFARIDTEGQRVGDVKPITDMATSSQPSLAWSGGEYVVSFIDVRDGGSEVYVTRLDALGNPTGAVLPVTDTDPWDESYAPSVAWSGSSYGIVYTSWRGSGDPQLYFSTVGCSCVVYDTDGDGWSDCAGDCDATDGNVYPGASEVCDGVSNDCLDEAWPRLPADWDNDGDGVTECQGDCDDHTAAAYPGALEVCDSIDNDCDMLIDEDASGEDTDGDTVGNLCDNCLLLANPTQSDVDLDAEGDVCDLNDGRLHVRFDDREVVEWDPEGGYDSWNVYRGSLELLRDRGLYTQKVQSNNPLSAHFCQIPGATPFAEDLFVPGPGEVAIYLTTGIAGGVESGLGEDGFGVERPNSNPCP